MSELKKAMEHVLSMLAVLDDTSKIQAINEVKRLLHGASPFKNEPVDCVLWVKTDSVEANDYNPNSVAPPEMKLLEVSIQADGYTQPVVADYDNDKSRFVVVDGFHRNRIARESAIVRERVMGYLPVVQIRPDQTGRSERMASTIRHNRARGKHQVERMSDIVIELKRRNWSGERISKELGMDADEVLRLCQINGLSEAFKDQQFSEAWEAERFLSDDNAEEFSDVIAGFEQDDKGRVFHTWEKWECYRAGFYAERLDSMTEEEGEEKYRQFLADLQLFESALAHIIDNWPHSCEHYLTNDRMNRVAWLGQASVAHALGIPSFCRGGYNKLSEHEKKAADDLALVYLNKWLEKSGRQPVSMQAAYGRTETELY